MPKSELFTFFSLLEFRQTLIYLKWYVCCTFSSSLALFSHFTVANSALKNGKILLEKLNSMFSNFLFMKAKAPSKLLLQSKTFQQIAHFIFFIF